MTQAREDYTAADAVAALARVDLRLGDLAAGRAWYGTARGVARSIARDNGTTLPTAAGIIAALSPRVTWAHNVKLARACAAGEAVRGLGNSVRAAERIRDGEPWDVVLRGPKVRAFAGNILGDEAAVTVDVWAARAAGWTRDGVPQYARRAIVAGYEDLAREFGETPAVMQAAVWVAVRGRAD